MRRMYNFNVTSICNNRDPCAQTDRFAFYIPAANLYGCSSQKTRSQDHEIYWSVAVIQCSVLTQFNAALISSANYFQFVFSFYYSARSCVKFI